MSLLVWLAFGAVAVAPVVQHLTWQILVYAVASLTLIRMVLVAAALAGTGPGWPTALFTGRNGPRGLASVVFALLALEELARRTPSRSRAAFRAITHFTQSGCVGKCIG